MGRVRVKPSKSQSLVGMIAGGTILNRLKEDGLIIENEFEKKRNEIMKSEW